MLTGLDDLRAQLRPGDVLLFRTLRPLSGLIRASEPDCPVNHAAIVTRAWADTTTGWPGAIVATWDIRKPARATASAIISRRLEELTATSSDVRDIYVRRLCAQGLDATRYAEAALRMFARTADYEFNAGGLAAICAGLIARNPRATWDLALAAGRCFARPEGYPDAIGGDRADVEEPRTGTTTLVTCSSFTYLCFHDTSLRGGNALGEVWPDRPTGPRRAVQPASGPPPRCPGGPLLPWRPRQRLPLPMSLLYRQFAATVRLLQDPGHPLWVTPGWLYRCPRLEPVCEWTRRSPA